MPFETTIQWLSGGSILAECGPMRLVISASQGSLPQKDACIAAAEESFRILERVARHRGLLSRLHDRLPRDLDEPLAMEMVRSALLVGDGLTPMATVAGTIAGAVADFLYDRGMTKAIVNNGGDIAVRLAPSASVTVGLRPDLSASPISGVLTLDGDQSSWGIATSGLEGRSLTRGVASAATIIAASASVADAAATAVANASFVDDPSVIQRPARELDPATDIPDVMVTVQAGPLSDKNRNLALERALDRAHELIREGHIFGAFIVVDKTSAMTDFVRQRFRPAD